MLPVAAQSNHFFFIEKLPKHKRLFKNPFIHLLVFDNSQVAYEWVHRNSKFYQYVDVRIIIFSWNFFIILFELFKIVINNFETILDNSKELCYRAAKLSFVCRSYQPTVFLHFMLVLPFYWIMSMVRNENRE